MDYDSFKRMCSDEDPPVKDALAWLELPTSQKLDRVHGLLDVIIQDERSNYSFSRSAALLQSRFRPVT
jgi:hypothetical protein